MKDMVKIMKWIIHIKAAVLLSVIFFCLIPVKVKGADNDEPLMKAPPGYTVNQDIQSDARFGGYVRFFPKDDIQEVRLEVKEEYLEYLLENAADKVSVIADKIKIGDETLCYVGLKTKGDYTLAHGVSDNRSRRFSFTVNFGKYVKKSTHGSKQNFYGLRKLSFNNFFFDKSMLKEYTSYYLFREMGVPVSEYGLAKVYINDEYYGVYFMNEAFDYSILERFYGVKKGELGKYLVKPENTDLEYDDIVRDPGILWNHDEETYDDVCKDIPMVTETIRKLNNLSNGMDFDGNPIDVNGSEYTELLEQIMDVDEVLRYFAVHSFLVQTDDMFSELHNYGLYCDPNGRIVLIPWDYDLSFGTFFPGTADSTANYDIDIMYCMNESWQDYENHDYSAGVYAKFPLFNVVFNNSVLMDRYHSYMMDCARIMALGGTTGDKRYYDPANMYNVIESLSDKLTEAASIKNAAHAQYMNNIRQPGDVKKGIPNIEKIIARRAVGVYSQISGDSGWITGNGCDLGAVGNGRRSQAKSTGVITSVDEVTGIFTTAKYLGVGPVVSFEKMEKDSSEYLNVVSSFTSGEEISVFRISDKGNAVSDYKVTFALDGYYEDGTGIVEIYDITDEGLKPLEISKYGNLAQVTLSKPDTFAVVEKKSAEVAVKAEEENEEPADRIGFKDTLFVGTIAVGILFLAGGIYTLGGRIKKRNLSKKKEKEDNG